MLGIRHSLDLDFKCNVGIACPVCERAQLELHWARKRLAILGFAAGTRDVGFFLKCRQCTAGTLYGPIEPGVADELQEGVDDELRIGTDPQLPVRSRTVLIRGRRLQNSH